MVCTQAVNATHQSHNWHPSANVRLFSPFHLLSILKRRMICNQPYFFERCCKIILEIVGVEEKELVAEYTYIVALPEFFIHFLNLLLFPLAATFNNGERIQSRVNGACIEPIHLFSRGSARFKISGEASAVLRNRDLKSKFPIF